MNYFKKSNLILGWAAFAVSALVYLLSMEPTASLWDCSEFIATSYKMEVGHPPGAPLFMMLNRFFTMFAPDTLHVAAMVNAASCIASALTIMFLFWTISHLGRRLMNKTEESLTKGQTWAVLGAALVGSLAYAFTDTFWFSAVEGEVYAQSSLFTALVFWAILKWENIADQPHATRWLVLVAYLMGLSIGVHLLNLLAIPAIVFVYYYRMNPVRSKLGWWKAFGASVVILAGALYVIIPMSVRLGAWFDRVFVNSFHLPVNSGMVAFIVLLFTALGIGVWKTYVKGKVVWNTILLCVSVMLLGYGTYASVVIRAVVNPPMNSNAPSDPYALLDLLNREQYGDNPLLYGQYYNAPRIGKEERTDYYYNTETKRYEVYQRRAKDIFDPRFMTFFPRMYSPFPEHIREYQNWGGTGGKKVKVGNETVVVPTFAQNLRYFFTYQLNFMYWRYFLWNFVGRQNDQQSQGEITKGNWLSGVTPIDELYLGPQDNLPPAMENNKGRNTYYFLPFILGLIGIMYQLKRDRNNFTVVMWLFFMTGIAIILYLNQPPLQPRERDYAFAGSFYAFTIWIGLGVLWVYNMLAKKRFSEKTAALAATLICLSVPVILIAQNWDDHSRAKRYVARDFGHNYLNSTLPNAIIMPFGDNDTFPLWYSQEVEEVRPDVKVMNLSYLGADWYVDQMRTKSNDADPVPFTIPKSVYYKVNEVIPVIPLLDDSVVVEGKELIEFMKTDSKAKERALASYGLGKDITTFVPATKVAIPVNKQNALASGIVAPEDAHLMVDTVYFTIAGQQLSRADYMLLDLLANYDWTRPLYVTSPTQSLNFLQGFRDYLQLDGFAYRFVPIHTPESQDELREGIGRINTKYLYDKLMNETKFGNIKDPDVYVDNFVENTFNTTKVRDIFGRLAKQLVTEGDTLRAVEVIDRVVEEVPSSQIAHNYNSFNLIEAAFMAGQTETARELLNDFREAQLDNLIYLAQFKGQKAQSVRQELDINIYYLQNLYLTARKYGQDDIVQEMENLFKTLNGE